MPVRSAAGPEADAGAETIDQLAPFQCSIKGPSVVEPIAKQSAVLEHETAERSPSGGPWGLALGTTVQPAPAADGIADVATTPATSTIAAINLAKPLPPHVVNMAAP
jgi:hypothetical protein